MNPARVTTVGEFRTFMLWLSKNSAKTYRGSLEEYLRALWPLIQERKNRAPSWDEFSSLFLDALTSQPVPFDETWLAYTSPPPTIIGRQPPQSDGFEELQQMVLFQIADLRRLEQTGVFKDEKAAIGLWLGSSQSPTGHRWANFDPASFLESMIYGLHEDSPVTECTWADMAILLWLGQIYE